MVNKEDYNSCNINNPLQRLDGGDSSLVFDKSGPFYFISGKSERCQKGQKLNVVVMAVRPTPPAPTPNVGPSPSDTPAPAPAPSSGRERPHYELRHTMRGHTSSISAVKFSPDGTLLASCGKFHLQYVCALH